MKGPKDDDIDVARVALHSLYMKALGSDFANEHDLRREFGLVDDMLDELEMLRLPQAEKGPTDE